MSIGSSPIDDTKFNNRLLVKLVNTSDLSSDAMAFQFDSGVADRRYTL